MARKVTLVEQDNARDTMKSIINWLDWQDYEITVLCNTVEKALKLYALFQAQDIFEFADEVWYGREDEEYRKEADALRKKMNRIFYPENTRGGSRKK